MSQREQPPGGAVQRPTPAVDEGAVGRVDAAVAQIVRRTASCDRASLGAEVAACLAALARAVGARRAHFACPTSVGSGRVPSLFAFDEEGEHGGPEAVLGVDGEAAPGTSGRLELRFAGAVPPRAEAARPLLEIAGTALASAVARVAREEALAEAAERFRTFAEEAPVLIAEFDGEGRYLYASPSFERVLGVAPDSLFGTSPARLLHPDDLATSEANLAEAYRTGGTAQAVHRLRHSDGRWRWFENTGRAFRTASGEARFVSIGLDVTDRRELEEALRESEAQLYQAQKMDSLGRLAGGIAHDFNNLLMVILGEAEILGDVPAAAEAAAEIRAAGERAAALTRQLLDFARPRGGAERALDVNDAVSGMVALLARTLGEDIELVLDLGEGPAPVAVEAAQLDQVVMNLAVNARDAMSFGGELRVVTRRRVLDDARAARLGMASGPVVQIVFADTGCGMSEGVRTHAFDPFFTTKDPGKGTGLGLAIVYRIVQRAGGAIGIESEDGKGTRIMLTLPLAEPTARQESAPAAEPVHHDARGTVLVVEDEDAVRRLVVRMLVQGGFDVIEARSPDEALDRIHPGVQLLLTDVVMPRVTGPELAARLRREHPGLRVLLMSGYPRRGEPGREELGYLEKPFTREQLLERVRETLRGEPS